MTVIICGICGERLIFGDMGWTHKDGSTIRQRCRNCGWYGGKSGSYSKCPVCGDIENLLDNHEVKVVFTK